MRLLLLNTCGAEGSLALADTELAAPVVALLQMPGRTASERLVAVLRAATAEADWKIGDLTAIGVVTGPGSFTGVRVGLSVAKGLSEATGVPLIAVSRLAMLAAAVNPDARRVCALLDAGRDEFYCGLFQESVESGELLATRIDAVRLALEYDAVVVCEATVAKALGDLITLQIVAEPTAADALAFVMKRFDDGDFDDPMTLDANYLRRTDAEIFAKPAAPGGR